MANVHVLTIAIRYGYDQECYGILGVFTEAGLAEQFRDDLVEHWDHFQENWHREDNRWGRRFYLNMSPQDHFDALHIEEWPVITQLGEQDAVPSTDRALQHRRDTGEPG